MNANQWQRWVGRTSTGSDPLHPFAARALAAALDRDVLPDLGDPLPPLAHWLYFLKTPRAAATGLDGHAIEDALLPPLPGMRRMWAEVSLAYTNPLQIGVPADRVSRVLAIESKTGRSGTLLFVRLEHCISQGGAPCLTELQTLVFRDIPHGPTALPDGERPVHPAQWTRELRPDPVLLFRFSALTYNSHRIHFDRDYAIQVEHYPGLLVHGPLIATLLLDLALQAQPGAVLRHFSFRAIRPTFAGGVMRLCARREGQDLELWSLDEAGCIGTRASAGFRDARGT